MKTKLLTTTCLLSILLLSACAPWVASAPAPAKPNANPVNSQNSQPPVYAPPAEEPAHPYATSAPYYPAPTQGVMGGAGAPSISQPQPPVDNFFQNYGVNDFVDTREDHLSTFAVDVDTAAYTVMRQYIDDGMLPPADAVRVEEFINYFNQEYAPPYQDAFAIYADGAFSPWHEDGTTLMRVGIQGYQVSDEQRDPLTLTLVLDVSGSMSEGNRLSLLQQSLEMLVDRLRPDDSMGIVAFTTNAWVVLEPVSGDRRNELLNAIYSLYPMETTNVEDGLQLGYQMAMGQYRAHTTNRVVLCSDGVANVDAVNPDTILESIHGYVSEGITLTSIGVGMGNFNDVLLEQMADKGNGNYAYIDDLDEARRLFVDNLTSTMQIIARDAKIQVDFNPDVVSRYRLVGYENRAVADQDFRDDQTDAGEIGAGHSVTAIYALHLKEGAEGRIATIQLRWKTPDTRQVTELNQNFNTFDLAASFRDASPRYQLAVIVAQYAEVLRQSPWAEGVSLKEINRQAGRVAEMLHQDMDVQEFYRLVSRAAELRY